MKIEVSIGELVDKVSILNIKKEKFEDTRKLENVKKEFNILLRRMKQAGIGLDNAYYQQLKKVNLKLWDIEDKIRQKEAKKEFDEEFIELARSVYFNNDDRAALKKRINLEYNSDLVEEKEYVDYKKT
ncbi:MAG: hypothetical protein KGY75_01670 [Candidatus Cloacimonetes bacterium]|nr:hypothetical protein [Candidatus Cloacimonadota bacterium]MBS3766819.1 hypothetical protein [Candidatus Cloacimonadota bacterium]